MRNSTYPVNANFIDLSVAGEMSITVHNGGVWFADCRNAAPDADMYFGAGAQDLAGLLYCRFGGGPWLPLRVGDMFRHLSDQERMDCLHVKWSAQAGKFAMLVTHDPRRFEMLTMRV